ncbi:hypothetical protein V7x_06490 [Crateriforma conspicua]|uniref:Glycoside hydrolase family 42 N-terminal domain-containing protein n=2 Tax=Planctomycetaceae TaxID=126 RepID=A0A5C6FVJ1_9PLAN|nr:hypothetical protein V7x_06490 [Crateriforma conspicua]
MLPLRFPPSFRQNTMSRIPALLIVGVLAFSASAAAQTDLWKLAQKHADTHRFSTLFTAQQVTSDLANDNDIDQAIQWCREMGITKVYLETFRTQHWAESETIAHARDRFRKAGFLVSGCVTTTRVGKISTGWNLISCYTAEETQQQTKQIFEFTAGLFDEIMIDDFWFTDCQCDQCEKARAAERVVVDGKTFDVDGDQWSDYRRELMLQVSKNLVLKPAREVNPNVSVIIKYPQWYDNFQERGYDVVRQTQVFDQTWVGTEIRDEFDERWGGRGRTTAYFLQSWVEGLSGRKCGGGWYDTLGTTPATYLSQARQTILGGANESMLFNAGNLRFKDPGRSDAEALRKALPELLQLAKQVRKRQAIGVTMYKPPNSDGENDRRVFEFVGMMGIPFVTTDRFPNDADAAFFSVHALHDADFVKKLAQFLQTKRPVILTDSLAQKIAGDIDLSGKHVSILTFDGRMENAYSLPAKELSMLRDVVLKPLNLSITAPQRTAIYCYSDGSWVVENFNDQRIQVTINGRSQSVEANHWASQWMEQR